MNNKTPTRANVIVIKQILNLIPREMINRHARETGVDIWFTVYAASLHR